MKKPMNEGAIRRLVDQLDAAVPTEEARVRLEQGPDALEVMATRAGALRLGIAFLRAGLSSEDEGLESDEDPVVEALNEPLVTEDAGSTWFERFELTDEIVPLPKPMEAELRQFRRRDRFGLVTCAVAVILLGIVFFAGVATVVQWLIAHRPG